ncbi:dnaJ homolog subfamily C member 28-like [Macrobrachium nipponense]|uniref:dnaJ homolog subfamily C member 28-like n=1 Tax=Macrobrachium nipponense TaxID=159736 RepID=UPI0030C7B6CC
MLALRGKSLVVQTAPLRYYQYLTARRSLHSNVNPYAQYYEALGVPIGSDQETVRNAFIKLAKKYHPDSGNKQADGSKFQMIENSYRRLMEKFSSERHNANKCEGEFGLYYEQKMKNKIVEEYEQEKEEHKEFDIEHTAPQHRQYLSYEGIGSGTPAQRQRQYTRYQTRRAAENVLDYRVKKYNSSYPEAALIAKDREAAKKIRTRYGIDRIVEDIIQEAIAKGDFDNLSNAGKPLKNQNHNPYVDTVTHKLNEVLINNGYAPEWIMLEKEIRDDRTRIRQALLKERGKLGPLPLTAEDEMQWQKSLKHLQEHISEMNKRINKYNLLVPSLSKQLVHFPLKLEAEKALKEGLSKDQLPPPEEIEEKVAAKQSFSFRKIFTSLGFGR